MQPVPDPLPIPSSPEDITVEWLGDALRAHDVDVVAVDVVEVHEVTNTHVKVRATYAGPSSVPTDLFVKMPPLDPARREAIAQTDMGRRESQFYAELAPSVRLTGAGVLRGRVRPRDTRLRAGARGHRRRRVHDLRRDGRRGARFRGRRARGARAPARTVRRSRGARRRGAVGAAGEARVVVRRAAAPDRVGPASRPAAGRLRRARASCTSTAATSCRHCGTRGRTR